MALPLNPTRVHKRPFAWTIASSLLAALLLCTSAAQAATSADSDTWMTVVLDGRKVGHAHFTREVTASRITTTQILRLELQRDGTPLAIETHETDIEKPTGEPLGFRALTRLSGIESSIEGDQRADGRFEVARSIAGQTSTSVIARPANALLAEGQRLAALAAGAKAGTRFDVALWDVNSGKALDARNTVSGKETVSLPDGGEELLRIDQSSRLPAGSIDTTLWLDDDFQVRKMRTSMLGMQLDLLACSEACAKAPNQGLDMLDKAMVSLPRALSSAERAAPIDYFISAKGGKPLHFIATDEQTVRQTDKGDWQIGVSSHRVSRQSPPTDQDTAANDWLQADDPALEALARGAAGDAAGDAERMQALEDFVRHYITGKNLDVGYASALEVMRDREGDCTEHAVLLAALARALGIPARIATGLVYTRRYAGRDNVLVPHAWVQAWVDDHWHGYDAALNGFDSGHIALETGDGDPWHFFNAVNSLGRIQVDKVVTPPR